LSGESVKGEPGAVGLPGLDGKPGRSGFKGEKGEPGRAQFRYLSNLVVSYIYRFQTNIIFDLFEAKRENEVMMVRLDYLGYTAKKVKLESKESKENLVFFIGVVYIILYDKYI